jgi:hypothetical protein
MALSVMRSHHPVAVRGWPLADAVAPVGGSSVVDVEGGDDRRGTGLGKPAVGDERGRLIERPFVVESEPR